MVERRRALITGGRGFVGGYLASQLEGRGFDISHFDLKDGKDITNRPLVLDEVRGYDVIFHLAGVLGTQELNNRAYKATHINVLGAINVFDAARESNSRVVLVSKPNPWLNTYSITKGTAEQFARMYTQMFGVDIRVGKFYSFYGPGQESHGVKKAIPTFIMHALQNEPIPVYGDGEQTADFIYISDACEAIAILGHLRGMNGEIIEIGSGEPTKINFLAETIIHLTDSRSIIEHLPMRSGEPLGAQIVADVSKMHELLQFRPQVSLEDGLMETITWFQRTYFGKTIFVSTPQ